MINKKVLIALLLSCVVGVSLDLQGPRARDGKPSIDCTSLVASVHSACTRLDDAIEYSRDYPQLKHAQKALKYVQEQVLYPLVCADEPTRPGDGVGADKFFSVSALKGMAALLRAASAQIDDPTRVLVSIGKIGNISSDLAWIIGSIETYLSQHSRR